MTGARPQPRGALVVEVLGGLQVLRDGRPLPLPPSRRARALLGYLAVQGRAQPRQRLCDLLWDGPDDPRGALRWSLAKLRPIVEGSAGGRGLLAEGDAVALVLGPEELDLAAVRAATDGGLERADLAALRSAAARFRGELLEGLEAPGCYRFEEWAASERAAARRLRLALLDALVARCADDPEEALVQARARVAADPLSEAGHVAVLRLLGRLGRTREGLEQYETCRQILASGLGARPSAELERARLALTASRPGAATPEAERRAATPASVPAARAPPPITANDSLGGPNAGLAFVGRAAEREVLARIVADVTSGHHRVLLVTGEPGMGKSRLLEELSRTFRAAGGRVARGRAYEAEMLRPYAAWLDALRDAPLSGLDEIQRAELAPLLPELGPPGPATDENRLFEAVARALAAMASEAPLALLLDDVQWLDERSAALLHFVHRFLRDRPVLLACAARPPELADNPGALRVARALSRAEEVTRLELGPLGPEEIAVLAESLGADLDPARVYRESEGNPLLALEVVRALRAGNDPSRSLDALLAERLEALPARAREVLPWAAVLGRSFQAERLARVVGCPAAELLSAIDELERRGVLRPGGAGYDFTHDLVRRAAYRALSAPRRQLLHREVARTLALLPDPDGVLAGEVAHHAALGDDAELAAQASVIAGARAARIFACAEARGLVERGLGFAQRLPEQPRLSLSLALLRVAVDASRTLGGDPGLVPRLEALIEEARARGLAAEEAAGHGILVNAHYANRDNQHAAELLGDGALPGIRPDGAALAMGEVAGCLALLERDIPRARLLVDECRRLGSMPPRAAVYVHVATAIIQDLEGDLETAAKTFDRALDLADEGAPWEECMLLARAALVELALGRPQRALERAQRIEAVTPRLGATGEALLPQALRAVAHRLRDDPVDDVALLQALEPLELDAAARFAELVCALAEGELPRGRVEPSRSLLARACAAAARVARPSLVVMGRALLARAELACGHEDAARLALEEARHALTPSVPMARAVRLIDDMARTLERPIAPARYEPEVERSDEAR
jgi:DNA-binding SARP family transcriptional activator